MYTSTFVKPADYESDRQTTPDFIRRQRARALTLKTQKLLLGSTLSEPSQVMNSTTNNRISFNANNSSLLFDDTFNKKAIDTPLKGNKHQSKQFGKETLIV